MGLLINVFVRVQYLRLERFRNPSYDQVKPVLGRLHQLFGVFQRETVEVSSVDFGHEVALFQAAALVRHRPRNDLFNEDLAAKHDAKVLLLPRAVQADRQAFGLRYRFLSRTDGRRSRDCRRKYHPPLNDEVDILPGITENLNCRGVVDTFKADVIGRDDSIVDAGNVKRSIDHLPSSFLRALKYAFSKAYKDLPKLALGWT